MALLDDEVLTTLLHESADSFDLPATGMVDVLGQARQDETPSTVPAPPPGTGGRLQSAAPSIHSASRTLRRTIRSHRLLSVAASLVLVLSLAGLGVLWGNTTPSPRTTAGLKAALGTPSRGATRGASGSTTTPSAPTNTGPTTSTGSPAPSHSSAANAATATVPTQTTTPPLPSGEVGQSARIEQTGSLDLTVAKGHVSATMTKLISLATTYGGFVATSQSLSGATGAPSGSVTVEIPVASFSAALKNARSLGRVSQLTTKATDVTGQYVDIQAQITALEASRQQYLTIMAKASSIGDVLAVQEQLDTLQSQIQQLQGQLQTLTSETDYSKLTVLVRARASVGHRHTARTASGWAKAWHDSVHGFVDGLEGLIRIAGPIFFVLLCLGALLVGTRLLWRRLQRHSL